MEEHFVTILFTDLVGSPSRSAQHGDEAAHALRREHFAMLRRAIAEHDGREVKSIGDGLMVAFSSAVAAVRCAVAMQRATSGGLSLRVGLDAGEPFPDGDDLYGTPVIVAGRLCDYAEGGQILASEVVCQIAGTRIAGMVQPVGALQAARRRRAGRGVTGALERGGARRAGALPAAGATARDQRRDRR